MTRFMWCSTSTTVSFSSSRSRRMKVASSSTSSWLSPPAGSSSRSEPRLRDERAGELDPLQRPERQARRRAVGVRPRCRRTRASRARGARTARSGWKRRHRVRADEHVLEHRHRREELDVLERARDPELDDAARRRVQQGAAVEDDVARVEAVEPRDHVERRRLAGAVRPDQAGDRALLGVEGDVVQGDDAAEAQRRVLQREKTHPRGNPMESASRRIDPSYAGSSRPVRRRPARYSCQSCSIVVVRGAATWAGSYGDVVDGADDEARRRRRRRGR